MNIKYEYSKTSFPSGYLQHFSYSYHSHHSPHSTHSVLPTPIYNICLPLVSIGNSTIATNAAKINAPATNTGALGFVPGILAAMMGAVRPPMRFRKLATPVPVPRFGAGNTSGVKAYRTPYMMFWKKASMDEKASWNFESAEIVNKNRKMPESRVEMAIVPLRPMYLISTV